MEVLEAIRTRRSSRIFKTDPVSKNLVRKVIDAGRLAPTARNIQPWEFIVVTDAPTRRQLALLVDHGKFIADAPVCIVVLSRDTKYYLEDGTAATTNMLLAACGLGLASCWVAGDKKDYRGAVVERLGAPPEMKLISLIALGYSDESASPPKRTLDEVLHWEEY